PPRRGGGGRAPGGGGGGGGGGGPSPRVADSRRGEAPPHPDPLPARGERGRRSRKRVPICRLVSGCAACHPHGQQEPGRAPCRFFAANSSHSPPAPPRCRASPGRKPIRRAPCASSCLSPPAARSTSSPV